MIKLSTLFTCSLLLLSMGVAAQDDGRLVKIPVIFHVLYKDSAADNGITPQAKQHGNSTQYLSRQKILAELADLDADFQLLNTDTNLAIPDFKQVIGNAKVHFFLADIIYVKVSSWGFIGTNTDFLHRQSPAVRPDSCLNVYTGVVRKGLRQTNGLTPVKESAGGDLTDDAVTLNFQWVGLAYRLLTHETGHWLGLWHTFHEYQLTRDHITDIPVQDGQTDTDCDFCPPRVAEPASLNATFHHSNYNNFMDYSGCRVMFSAQQAAFIRHVIRDFRPLIWARSQ